MKSDVIFRGWMMRQMLSWPILDMLNGSGMHQRPKHDLTFLLEIAGCLIGAVLGLLIAYALIV